MTGTQRACDTIQPSPTGERSVYDPPMGPSELLVLAVLVAIPTVPVVLLVRWLTRRSESHR